MTNGGCLAFPIDFKSCRNHTYPGTGVLIDPKNPAGGRAGIAGGLTYVHPYCTALTLISPRYINCQFCDSYVRLVATLLHECAHASQPYFGNGPNDEFGGEHYAAKLTAEWLTNNAQALCTKIVAKGKCDNMRSCLAAVKEQAEWEWSVALPLEPGGTK